MNVFGVLLAFWLPGLVFGAAAGLRGWTLAAAGPLLTFGLVALGVPVLGAHWTLPFFALWAAVLSAVAFAVTRSRFTGSGDEKTIRDHLLIGLGVFAGMGIGAVTFLRGIGRPDAVHQGWDAPFHANLVRWIAEHGDARPSTVGTLANLPRATDYFYPDTYHALLALTLGRGGPVAALNFGALALVLALPLGVAALGRAWRLTPNATAAAAAASTCFTAFPYDSLARGPLWPYVAAVALLPALLALGHHLVEPRGRTGPVVIALGVAGLAALHTSIVFVVAAYLALILVTTKVDWRTLDVTAGLTVVLTLPVVLPSLSDAEGVTSATWPTQATVSAAVGQTITFSPMADFPQWWLGVPALIGIGLLVRQRRLLWLVGAYVVFGGLFAATVSLETPLVHALSSPFYNDHWRIAALIPLAGAVAFGVCADAAAGWLARKAPRPAVLTLAAVVLFALVSRGGYTGRNTARVHSYYGDGPTVTAAEQTAFAWLAAHTEPGERVLNDRADGSVWMYALAGVRPVQWTFYGAPPGTDAGYLSEHARDVQKDAKVRSLLADLGVRYAFVGEGKVSPTAVHDPGLRDLGPGFRLVYRDPGAAIYEIDGRTPGESVR